ncbi:MAG: hypothetical protein ACKOAH_09345, partial [Pirellula sp.]
MKRTLLHSALLGFASSFLLDSIAHGEELGSWTSWRGPKDSGAVETGNFPVSLTKDKLRWSASLPGKGCSTPIHLDGKI